MNHFELTDKEFETVCYGLSEAERMWRYRSHHLNKFVRDDGENMYTEEECRGQMKRFRDMKKKMFRINN